jgi:enoyl-CoA hydratase/carnithine racemase
VTEYQKIRIEARDPEARIILNDPDNGNALDPYLIEAELAEAFRALDRDRQVRAIVITAAGPDFCVGARHAEPPVYHDARDAGRSSVERLAHGYTYGTLWEAVADVHKPLIAAVRGRCRDGGFGIALACDVVIAGRGAEFADRSVERGRSPFWPSAPVLVRALGKHRANELLLLGRPMSALDAHQLGLVTMVVDDDQCEDFAAAAARELASRPPIAVAFARHLARKAVDEMGDYQLTRSWAYHSVSAG